MMYMHVKALFHRLTLAQQFMLAGLFVLMVAALGVGWWVSQQIEAGVVRRAGATAALYVDSFIAPYLQELGQQPALTPEHTKALHNLLRDTPLGQQIVAFKVWDPTGRLLYSTDTDTIGRLF